MAEPLSKRKLGNALALLAILIGMVATVAGVVIGIVGALLGQTMTEDPAFSAAVIALAVGIALIVMGWTGYEDETETT